MSTNDTVKERVQDLKDKELIRANDELVFAIRRTIGNHFWVDSLTAEQLESVRRSVRTFIEWPGVEGPGEGK